jgi:hypothetical protein
MSIPLCSPNDPNVAVPPAREFAYAATPEPNPPQALPPGGLCTVPTGAPAPRASEDFQTIIRGLPQNGGKPETAAELVTQGQSSDPRVTQLFGNVPLMNLLEYVGRGSIPEGRNAGLRETTRDRLRACSL